MTRKHENAEISACALQCDRDKRILHIKISPKFLHRTDCFWLCFGFTHHASEPWIRKLGNTRVWLAAHRDVWTVLQMYDSTITVYKVRGSPCFMSRSLRDGARCPRAAWSLSDVGGGHLGERPSPRQDWRLKQDQGSRLPAQSPSRWIQCDVNRGENSVPTIRVETFIN